MWRFPVLSFVVLLVTATVSGASVFERDWKTPGDGLLTYDDVNNREWLDLSESLVFQFPGATLEARYQSVVAETLPGGLFDGFAVASRAEVILLAQSAGIAVETDDFATNAGPVGQMIDLLSATLEFSGGHLRSYGFIDEVSYSPSGVPFRFATIFRVDPRTPPLRSRADLSFSINDDFIGVSGVLLYRAIPEPDAWMLFGCGASFWYLTFLARKRLRTS
jgi:hypothetical protein